MTQQNNTRSMGLGSIPKLLAQLAIPAVAAQIVNLLYYMEWRKEPHGGLKRINSV